MTTVSIDETKLESFVGQVVSDMAAAQAGVLTYLGDRLGLYGAMSGAGPVTPAQLAERTDTNERSVREWLNAQTAGGYVTFDPAAATYELPREHAMVLADQDSPVGFAPGAFEVIAASWGAADKAVDAFRSGAGVGWAEFDSRLARGVERFFRPGYRANLTSSWLPALEGVDAKLQAGARVADVGCGHGASSIAMAEAYPASTFSGFDFHDESIEAARRAAADAGVADRVSFDVATAQEFPGSGYDLVCFFDCLHDMGDPVGAARQARQALADDGTVLLVEPFANDALEDNLNPVGRAFYAFSTIICTQNSLAQDVGAALGAQAGEARLADVMHEAGFTRFRRATETPFNLILEARP